MIIFVILITSYVVLLSAGDNNGNKNAFKVTKTNDKHICENDGHLSSQLLKQTCIVENNINEKCMEFSHLDYNKTACNVLHIHIDNYTMPNILQAIGNADNDISIRKMTFSLKKNITLDYDLIGNITDTFLIPRPWWRVIKEPYSWQRHHHHFHEIVFERTLVGWELFYKFFASVHFPSDDVCKKTALLVGKSSCVHPGWFSVIGFYVMTHGQHPYAIHNIFYPDIIDRPGIQLNAWVNISECPNNPNKWTCAFLPSSNCSFPKVVLDCNKNECNNEQNTGFSLLLTSASSEGKIVNRTDVGKYGQQPITELQKNLSNNRHPQQNLRYVLPYNVTLAKTSKAKRVDSLRGASVNDLLRFNLLLRKAYFYRTRIAKILHQFRVNSKPHLDASTPCVAAQIRRGDRIIICPEVDPVEYCHNKSLGLQCMGCDNRLGYCHPDAGCENGVPFVMVNVSHVVDKMKLLAGPTVKNIILISDDFIWVDKQIEKMKVIDPSWNIYALPPPRPPVPKTKGGDEPFAGYHYMRSDGATASGSYLFASMELASQCQAFMGHFMSGSTMMYHQYMCLNHNGKRGLCPPTYDFNSGLWL